MPINGITGAGGGVGGWLFRGGRGGAAGATPAEGTSSGSTQTPSAGLAPGNGWVYHTFSGPGTFTVTSAGEAQIFALGGGAGSSGHAAGGGGGAGGLVYDTVAQLTPGSYTVTVGDAVPRGPGAGTAYGGQDSSVSGNGSTWTGKGGGRGGAYSAGTDGGCGGAHAGYPPGNRGSDWSNAPYGAVSNQYSAGNPSTSNNYGTYGGGAFGDTHHAGGGGGGIGAHGRFAPSPTQGGRGGPGIKFRAFNGPLIGMPGLAPFNGGFGGGGGAGAWSGENGEIAGEDGGGSGRISYSSPSNPGGDPGSNHVGGGGGGGNGPTSPGGGGGSGLVIIRYRDAAVFGGNGSSSSTPIRTSTDLAAISSSGNYWIQTRSMGNPTQFWVDTSMPDGPWIRAFVAPVDQNTVDSTWTGAGGDAEIPGLLTSANRFVYSFVNVNDGTNTNAWSWWFTNGFNEDNYSNFIGNPPQRHGDNNKPLLTRIDAKRLSTGVNYNGYWLRTAVTSFGTWCDSGRSGIWGQICLKDSNAATDPGVGSNSSPGNGLLDFPQHSGFSTTTGDYCSGSDQSYATSSCSATRRFAIHCNIFEPELP